MRFLHLKILKITVLTVGFASIAFFILPLPGTIPVLMYHRVGTEQQASEEGNVVTREDLDRQMAFLKRFGYRVITLDHYHSIITQKRRAAGREIVITFDDGDMTFLTDAVPVLEKYGFPVSMFIISDKIQTGADGSMRTSGILELQKKYSWLDFESHSKTHAHFKEISREQLKEEIADSKTALEKILGKPVLYFTYPYGEFDAAAHELAEKAGYRIAFTTGHKRLDGIPEGLFSKTRVKIDRHSGNLLVFWYYLSGIHQTLKGMREQIKNLARPAAVTPGRAGVNG